MPKPRAHRATTKRDAILASALDLLLAQGYDGTSMDAVAAQAGVSKTTVYAHFSDKGQLFYAVMAHAASMLAPSYAESLKDDAESSHRERLVLALTEVVKVATFPELIAFFRVLATEHSRREELRGVLEEARSDTGAPGIIEMLAPFIEAVAEERGVTLENPEQWVILLLRLSAPTLQFDMLTSDFQPDPKLVEMHVRLVVDIFVDGAFPQGATTATLPAGYDAYPWGPAFDH